MKISIKICVPKEEEKQYWGDYHFASALKKYFERGGHYCAIDIMPDWYAKEESCHVVIVLRGLSRYVPEKKHINIMWNISHPELISEEEYSEYDIVFVASDILAKKLKGKIRGRVETLYQCTDPEIFFNLESEECKSELLFVGNSRNVFRSAIKDLLPTDKSLSVWGRGWDSFIKDSYIKGDYLDNKKLNLAYSSCSILLNDHWPDMKKNGFISNRIFDALACKAFIISDNVAGINDVLEGSLICYNNREDLKKKVNYYLNHPEGRAKIANTGFAHVIGKHTFADRVQKILAALSSF